MESSIAAGVALPEAGKGKMALTHADENQRSPVMADDVLDLQRDRKERQPQEHPHPDEHARDLVSEIRLDPIAPSDEANIRPYRACVNEHAGEDGGCPFDGTVSAGDEHPFHTGGHGGGDPLAQMLRPDRLYIEATRLLEREDRVSGAPAQRIDESWDSRCRCLSRAIGRVALVGLVLNVVIGSSVFGLPAVIAAGSAERAPGPGRWPPRG